MIEPDSEYYWVPAARISAHLQDHYGLSPKIGIEREFYVLPATAGCALLNTEEVMAGCPHLVSIDREAGPGQFEYILRESSDVDSLIRTIPVADQIIEAALERAGGKAVWDTHPLDGEAASSIHVHISLHDVWGKNVFERRDRHGVAGESETMCAALNGLLESMIGLTYLFAPTEECYSRFYSTPYPAMTFSPSNVTWGYDNRSAALRLPGTALSPHHRRIEHRLSSSAAKIDHLLVGVLAGMWLGLKQREPLKFPILFGLANHPSIEARPLPGSLTAAFENFERWGIPLLKELASEVLQVGPPPHEQRRGD